MFLKNILFFNCVYRYVDEYTQGQVGREGSGGGFPELETQAGGRQ